MSIALWQYSAAHLLLKPFLAEKKPGGVVRLRVESKGGSHLSSVVPPPSPLEGERASGGITCGGSCCGWRRLLWLAARGGEGGAGQRRLAQLSTRPGTGNGTCPPRACTASPSAVFQAERGPRSGDSVTRTLGPTTRLPVLSTAPLRFQCHSNVPPQPSRTIYPRLL